MHRSRPSDRPRHVSRLADRRREGGANAAPLREGLEQDGPAAEAGPLRCCVRIQLCDCKKADGQVVWRVHGPNRRASAASAVGSGIPNPGHRGQAGTTDIDHTDLNLPSLIFCEEVFQETLQLFRFRGDRSVGPPPLVFDTAPRDQIDSICLGFRLRNGALSADSATAPLRHALKPCRDVEDPDPPIYSTCRSHFLPGQGALP